MIHNLFGKTVLVMFLVVSCLCPSCGTSQNTERRVVAAKNHAQDQPTPAPIDGAFRLVRVVSNTGFIIDLNDQNIGVHVRGGQQVLLNEPGGMRAVKRLQSLVGEYVDVISLQPTLSGIHSVDGNYYDFYTADRIYYMGIPIDELALADGDDEQIIE